MRKQPLKYIIISLILIGLLGLFENNLPQAAQDFLRGYNGEISEVTIEQAIILSDERKRHILYGDERGGGHRYGAGVACKSEFPADWDDEKIISTTKRIAANDNLDWKQQNNGYYIANTFEDGVKIRVVLGDQKQRVITSYPTNMPRNPCPSKILANDNRR